VEATGGDDEFDQPVDISTESETPECDKNLEEIDDDEELLDLDNEIPNIKIYKCVTCGVIKNNKSSLDRHQYEHTGKIPFPCK